MNRKNSKYQELYIEEVIIAGCKNNDRKSQEALYRHYFRKLFLMCYRYASDESKASEMVHDAFMTVYLKINKYENKGSFEGWIRRITFNTIADHFRKEKRDIKFLLIDDISSADHPDRIQSGEQLDYDFILSKIYSLQGHFKDVFIKYAIEGYNHKEIGEELNISEGTSKWYLSEARKKLQTFLNSNIKDINYGR